MEAVDLKYGSGTVINHGQMDALHSGMLYNRPMLSKIV